MEDRKIKILDMIAKDMENDAKEFDGKLFNGKTVAIYFGNQGAAIAAIANIVKQIIVGLEVEVARLTALLQEHQTYQPKQGDKS
jgi:hypothetical protein